jgi:hypothetical protein
MTLEEEGTVLPYLRLQTVKDTEVGKITWKRVSEIFIEL